MATTHIQIGPADHGRRMTLDEFRDAEEESGYRYELARGVLEVTEVPNDPHWQVVSNLQAMVYRYRDAHPRLILRIGGGGECRVWVPGMVSGRNPDMAIVFHGAPRDERGRRMPGLVAEVVSRGGEERDYRDKRQDYLAYGVREYWIIDPELRYVTVFIRRDRPEGLGWEEKGYSGSDIISSELLPGFAGTVAELWADIEPDGEITD